MNIKLWLRHTQQKRPPLPAYDAKPPHHARHERISQRVLDHEQQPPPYPPPVTQLHRRPKSRRWEPHPQRQAQLDYDYQVAPWNRLVVEGGGELDVAREELGNAVLDLTCHTQSHNIPQRREEFRKRSDRIKQTQNESEFERPAHHPVPHALHPIPLSTPILFLRRTALRGQ